jgi:ABC-2 type transport system ATP-binding protein
MITAEGLTKRYGSTVAVDNLSFEVRPGLITGFLGPNGSGKSTTMRMILGLDNPTSGTVTVNGRSYRDIPAPIHEVGALLDAKAVDGSRTARQHLTWLAMASDVDPRRVDEVLGMVGLESVAGKKIRGFSLGMSQRLGIATALLGDPGILLFDEPVNGLDPDGIRWFRTLMQGFAKEGRTVFVSSHLMSEMQATADHVLVIGKGRLVADAPLEELMATSTGNALRVRSPKIAPFTPILEAAGATVTPDGEGAVIVRGMSAEDVGNLAHRYQVPLHELASQRGSLETAFMDLTRESVEYGTSNGRGHDVAMTSVLRELSNEEEVHHV